MQPVQYKIFVYTKTVDSVKVHSNWLVKLRISFTIYLQATREKGHPGLHPWHVKKSSKLSFCGIYYLTTVLVYTKTTIHLSVGGSAVDIYLAASQLGKYPMQGTDTEVKCC